VIAQRAQDKHKLEKNNNNQNLVCGNRALRSKNPPVWPSFHIDQNDQNLACSNRALRSKNPPVWPSFHIDKMIKIWCAATEHYARRTLPFGLLFISTK
jgi:hypothetical protein